MVKKKTLLKFVDFSIQLEVIKAVDLAVKSLSKGGIIVVPWGKPQRRIFAMLGVADDPEVAKKINRAKGRPEDQVLSVCVIPEVIKQAALVNKSKSLKNAARKLGKKPEEILGEILEKMPMGFFLEALPDLGSWVTSTDKNGRKVVYIGGGDTKHQHNFYSLVYKKFFQKYGRLLIATSANKTGEDTHPVTNYKKAYEELKGDVDLIFIDKEIKIHPMPFLRHLVSPTMINLLKNPPQLIRRGSKHERILEPYFGKIKVPGGVKSYKNAARKWEALIEIFFSKFAMII